MATSKIQRDVGGPGFSYDSTLYQLAQNGMFSNASDDRVTLSDAMGNRIVFKGSFDVVGGVVQSGTITGFSVHFGSARVAVGEDFDLTFADVVDAITVSQATFVALLEAQVTRGSGQSDSIVVRKLGAEAFGGSGNDFLLGGDGRQNLHGEKGNDTIFASTGNDRMFGEAGDDLLYGGAGRDRCNGGSGRDTFVLSDANSFDIITDFAVGIDTLGLEGLEFEALGFGFVAKSEFRIGSQATTSKQHLIYNDNTGVLYYDEDGEGGSAQVKIAELDRHLDLRAKDFFIGIFD